MLLGTVRHQKKTLSPPSSAQLFLTNAVHEVESINAFEFPWRRECCSNPRKNTTFKVTDGCSQTKVQEANSHSHEEQTSLKKAHLQTLKNLEG